MILIKIDIRIDLLPMNGRVLYRRGEFGLAFDRIAASSGLHRKTCPKRSTSSLGFVGLPALSGFASLIFPTGGCKDTIESGIRRVTMAMVHSYSWACRHPAAHRLVGVHPSNGPAHSGRECGAMRWPLDHATVHA